MSRVRVPGVAAAAAFVWLVSAPGSAPEALADPVASPTAYEQYMIEILNRTRADPAREAARFRIDLNEGLDPGTLSADPREPLAVDLELVAVARAHNRDLFRNFANLPPDHRGSDGRDPTQRASDAGVSFLGGVAENNSWVGQSSTAVAVGSVHGLHALLFKDFTPKFQVVGRGHRKVMLNDARDTVGVAVSGGVFGGKTAAICTQDFVTTSRVRIVGVVYADVVQRNRFYTPGEGLGGATVVVTPEGAGAGGTTTSWASGGWQLDVPPGTYTVTASGGGLPEPQTVTGVVVGDRNVKVDFRADRRVPVPPPPAFDLADASAKLGASGAWSLNVKKAKLHLGTFSLPSSTLAEFAVVLDGTTWFAPQDRAASTVVETRDPASGDVRKLVVRDAAGNSFSYDVRTGALRIVLKGAAGFDPTDGTVDLRIDAGPLGDAVVSAASTAVGTSGKKRRIGPAEGDVSDD